MMPMHENDVDFQAERHGLTRFPPEPSFSELELAIMEKVFVKPLTTKELAAILNRTPSSIRGRLCTLEAKNAIKVMGKSFVNGRREQVWGPVL